LERNKFKSADYPDEIRATKISLGRRRLTQIIRDERSGEISQSTFDEFDKRHYGVENKLINLAKSLTRKMKNGQDWNSDYKTE
jgi:hypothetical protein